MRSDYVGKVVYLTLIAGRKQQEALLHELSKSGLKLTSLTYGKGTVKASYLKDALGLNPEENKVVITGLLPQEKIDTLFNMLVERFHFDKPNTGIAYTIPIEKLSL